MKSSFIHPFVRSLAQSYIQPFCFQPHASIAGTQGKKKRKKKKKKQTKNPERNDTPQPVVDFMQTLFESKTRLP